MKSLIYEQIISYTKYYALANHQENIRNFTKKKYNRTLQTHFCPMWGYGETRGVEEGSYEPPLDTYDFHISFDSRKTRRWITSNHCSTITAAAVATIIIGGVYNYSTVARSYKNIVK